MKKFQEKVVKEISGYVCDRCGREAEAHGGEVSIPVKRAIINCFKGATCYYLKVAIVII